MSKRGKPLSRQHKAKISRALKGRKRSRTGSAADDIPDYYKRPGYSLSKKDIQAYKQLGGEYFADPSARPSKLHGLLAAKETIPGYERERYYVRSTEAGGRVLQVTQHRNSATGHVIGDRETGWLNQQGELSSPREDLRYQREITNRFGSREDRQRLDRYLKATGQW